MAATSIGPSTASFDPRQLDALKLGAKSSADGVDGGAAATRKVAQQFESMFLSMMLKNMRASLPTGDPMANDASKMATEMYDQQLAQTIATKGRGLGLADALVAQIERSQGKSVSSSGVSLTPTLDRLRMPSTVSKTTSNEAATVAPAATTQAAPTGPIHQTFVERFKEAAMAAAEASGLPIKVILGQAALESSWGRREVRDAQGTGSFNLFGIKAGPSWTGPTVDAVTTEVVNGVAQKVVQKFRAYASYAESFTDYAKLVANNPRYEKAVQAAGDALAFAKEMGRSGYATDPAYGNKLAQVLTGPLSRLL